MQSHDRIKLFLIITTLLILFLVALISTIIFLYQKKRIAFIKNFEAVKLDHEKSLLKTQLEIQEYTFQNISREIHDNISLSLTLAKLHLNTTDFTKREAVHESIGRTVDLISNAINDLSNISKSLNTEAICSNGLIAALEIEIEKIRRYGQHQIDLVVTGNPVYMDPQKELVLFRITQEALNNILKHANATSIHLQLNYHHNCIDLQVKDNGVGFNKDEIKLSDRKKMMAGLTNMVSRANLINGICDIESKPRIGTIIAVTAPF